MSTLTRFPRHHWKELVEREHAGDTVADAIMALYAEIDQLQSLTPAPAWLPISPESMPPDKEYILLADITKPFKSGIFLGQYLHNEGAWDCTDGKFRDAHVWQPLTPPSQEPKEELCNEPN